MTPERFSKLRRVLDRRQPDLTLLADGVHKPHNVSAILRSCDAVGVYRLHAVSATGQIRRHHMMAGGSVRWVEITVHRSIKAGMKALRADSWRLAVAHVAAGARDFREVDYTERVAVVLGAELHGPSDYALEHSDFAIAVPMQGMVSSLNVSVAAALILFEAQRQRLAAGLYEHSRLGAEDYRRTLFEWAYPDIARRCREQSLEYPALAGDGSLIDNPFSARRARGR